MANWPDAGCGYIRLSEFYVTLAEWAHAAGWPVTAREVGHLHMLIRPKEVVELILEMANQIEQ